MDPNLRGRLAHYAKRGWHGRHWYRNLRRYAARRYGPASQVWLACFALTSPNCSVSSNYGLADKALKQWQTGAPFTGYLPQVIRDLEAFRRNPAYRPAGLKVRAFTLNLMGNHYAVTIDRWIGRAAGLNDIPRGRTRQTLEMEIRILAELTGTTPAEMQAAIWTGVRS